MEGRKYMHIATKNKIGKLVPLAVGAILALLVLAFVGTLPAFSADEIQGDYIIIDGGDPYLISDTPESIVAADLALIQWNAKGNSTTDDDSKDRITGVIDGQPVKGYWAAYSKIYDRLLEKSTSSMQSASTQEVTANKGDIIIYKLYKKSGADNIEVSLKHARQSDGGTLIILVDNTADFEQAILTASSTFTVSSGGKLIIQGPSPDKKIVIKGNGQNSTTARSSSLITVKSGSLYLVNCEITDYNFGSSHAVNLSSGNAARYTRYNHRFNYS